MISKELSKEELLFLSLEYHLDDSDPDIVVLRRQDDAFVAAFSARGRYTPGRASSKRLRRITGSSCGFSLGPARGGHWGTQERLSAN